MTSTQPAEPQQLRFYKVREVAQITRQSEWGIRRLIRSGQIPAVRHGKFLLVPVDGFEAYLAALPRVGE
ncbi:helix-turn-helix domain-containing protein [Nakamurella leprariae]|uniref:Helix-turn-helix domain-containing protein n=1 Tax=Nakamurella leprariae TaxID=2803911 RepID=A0A938YG71_9ACTN|nr:helix-turn-helix domain-containing protein [Nakamurella leprariae]MBM9467238.1 helix-turn-helix domain-containing protein [Nakamurella leprariae]